MVGKSTISGTSVVSNTKKSLSQVWMSLSTPLRLGNCVAISLGKICWTSSKLAGESSNRSLSCCDFVHRPFFKGGFVSVPPVIAARVSGVPVFIHESDLSMGLANKIAYKFATKMYSTLSKLRVCLRLSMWEQWPRFQIKKIQNQMNWWIFKPTLIINCRLYCLLAVLQVLVSLTNWWQTIRKN